MQTIQTVQVKRERESIHSGQFMVSHFEAEEQDDEDEVAVPIPEEGDAVNIVPVKELLEPGGNCGNVGGIGGNSNCQFVELLNMKRHSNSQQQLSIDTSLAKLFQCMSLAYRQKLTSPKWNRFRGIRLRWKDKIRLNNVIWRCWHMQFIKKKNTFVCQFASPLDVDTHNKPEAIVLEGKYWKRKLAAVTAEYKKWRMFYSRHHSFGGHSVKDDVEMLNDTDLLNWNSQSNENVHMMVDEDYMGLMSDTLFSTITNQPFVFPDSREIAKAGLADFIQPSLGPLQPNLDDYMDTFEPLQEFVAGKLPTVPEEQTHATTTTTWNYSDLDLISNTNLQLSTMQPVVVTPTPPPPPPPPPLPPPVNYHTTDNQLFTNQLTQQQSVYHGVVQSTKSQSKSKRLQQQQQQQQIHLFDKTVYTTNYPSVNEQIQQLPSQTQQQLVMVQSPQISPSPSNDLQQFDPTVVTSTTTSTGTTTNILNDVGYKFTNTSIQNIKFTSQVPPTTPPPPPPPYHMSQPISVYPQYDTMRSLLKDDKIETHEQSQRNSNRNSHNNSGNIRIKQRSRSNTREVQKRPPLISAVSDPSLLSQKNSLLLTQLLGNSNSGSSNNDNSLFNRNQIQIKEENSNSMPILPQQQQQQTTTLIITTPCINTVQTTVNNDPLSFSSSNSPILETSQPNINSPTSSQGSLGSPGRDHTPTHRDQRRVGHIHAEQKRRYNIKNGFDMIHSLIPHLNQNPNAKLSKATMLQKGAEYIRQLRSERNQLNEEMECLRQQIETLNTSISNCQSMLPATGAPVSRKRDSKMQEMFDDYVRKRTMEDWKYYIFSLLFRPLLDSFNTFVSTSSLEDLYRSTMLWIEQHCTLGDLRRVVLNSLKYLSTKTEILTEPERLPEEARQLVMTTTTTNPNN